MSDFVVDKISAYVVETLLPSLGLELFDVQFRQEDRGWVLRIFIDSPDGVSLDHCTEVSRDLSAYLEVEDIITHAYHLEVSSPGLERQLRNATEFERFIGQFAKVKLHHPVNDQKVFIGTIQQVTDQGVVSLDVEDTDGISFSMEDVNQARLFLN